MKSLPTAKTASAWAFGALFFGFMLWTFSTDLDYGVHADGHVANRFANIPVQHNTMAKVIDVRVREGQRVRAGEVLLTLDDADVFVDAGRVESQRLMQMLQLYSLRSELRVTNHFPRPLIQQEVISNSVIDSAYSEVLKSLQQRLAAHKVQLAQFDLDIRAARTQMASLREANQRVAEQMAIVERELAGMIPLSEDRLIPRSAVDERKYRVAELQKTKLDLLAEHSRQEALVEQTLNKRIAYLADREKEIRAKLAELESDTKVSAATASATSARLKSKVIVAAADGQVINVKVRNAGQVIEAGAVLMELVQQRRQYFIEAKIRVAEIENIRPDMPAEIHFITLPSKSTPYVEGRLVSVANNSTINEKSGDEFYITSVDFDADVTKAIGVEPTLGMPVQVLLKGGRRSVVSYITEPFRVLARKAMKES